MKDLRSMFENLIILPVVILWLYATLPYYVVILFIPYMVVRTWMGGSLELTVLAFDGLIAFLLLLRKPLKKWDKAVRDFNDKRRAEVDKQSLEAA